MLQALHKKKDADVATTLQKGEVMFQLFSDLSSKLENDIFFFLRTMQNSSFHKAATLEARIKDRRLTSNIGSASDKK